MPFLSRREIESTEHLSIKTGTQRAQGQIYSQGVLVSGGVLVSNGILVGDVVLVSDGGAYLTTILGDNTACMQPAP